VGKRPLLGFDPPNFPVSIHAASRGGRNFGNELSYGSTKATEAAAPEAT
jgi:hypothetical protein